MRDRRAQCQLVQQAHAVQNMLTRRAGDMFRVVVKAHGDAKSAVIAFRGNTQTTLKNHPLAHYILSVDQTGSDNK